MPPLKYPINEEGSNSGSRDQPQRRRRRRSSASSAPSLRRSSRLKRRRVEYADSSDNMDLDGEEYGSRADHGGDDDYEIPGDSDDGTEENEEEDEEDEEENEADDYEGSLGYHSHIEDDGFQRPMEKCCHIEEGDHDSVHHENQRDHGYNADDDNEDDKPSTTPHSEEQPEAEAFLLLEGDRGLTLSILFAAIVPISELQLLVYYDKKNDKYFLHGDEVDWISVSTVAEGLAPNGFKGLYSPEACRDMFLSKETDDFRQNAMLPKNWETFRTTMSFDDDHPGMVDHFARNVGDEGTCLECGIFTYRLKDHSDSCIGQESKSAPTRPSNNATNAGTLPLDQVSYRTSLGVVDDAEAAATQSESPAFQFRTPNLAKSVFA
ncbi:hypothetical protein FMEXI_13548 [Fusarium mexicanum]|uniref:Uncharacterized protein n=1 Tax=Fusarium mexicanum TaxID=751941 RepID=A0A8H5I9V8_9HYPO|nr:hypothetical protein FMEXI_13548 [Fusarium mexicanum]